MASAVHHVRRELLAFAGIEITVRGDMAVKPCRQPTGPATSGVGRAFAAGGRQPEGSHATSVYRFSALIVSTMLSLRIIAPEIIMVMKTTARAPAIQARIAPQGSVKAKALTPPNWK